MSWQEFTTHVQKLYNLFSGDIDLSNTLYSIAQYLLFKLKKTLIEISIGTQKNYDMFLW